MCKVSVLMSTYKETESYLRQAIESILDQTFKDFEFIIILDNPDNKEHIAFINDYVCKDERIKFYINDKNMGLTNTLNRGLKLAEGKYICRMDADDISELYRMEHQKKYLEENDFDLIGGISQMIDEDGNTIYSIKKVPTNFKKIKKCIKYNQVISHPTWFGKKEVFDKLNGYRNMPLCEDYDFTLRAILQGFKISNVNECVLKYRMTKDSISRSNLFEQYLFARYITKQYSEGKVSEVEEAKAYVKKNLSDKNAKRYLKGNERFNNALNNLEEKQYIQFIANGIALLFTSKYYLDKIFRFIMVYLNS